MEAIKELLPVKAIRKLRESVNKKYIILAGEPGLLKSEVINKFLEESNLKNVRFLLGEEDRAIPRFLTKIGSKLLKEIAETIEGLKMVISNYFREEKEINFFVFERFEEIIGSESLSLFWDLTLNSRPQISFIIETREDIRTPLETQTERIGREYFIFEKDEIMDFLKKHEIKIEENIIEEILKKTGGHGFFTRIFLSEYIEHKHIPEGSDIEIIYKILKERFSELKPETKSLLMGLSCLDKFRPMELQRILGIKDAYDFIEQMSKKFIFFEKQEDFYYLNPIFKDFLTKELERHPRGIILKKWILDNAIEYYLEQEDYFSALNYLEKLKFYSKILDIINRKFLDITETNRALEIEPIIEKLPDEIKNSHPIALLLKAHICLLKHDFEGIIETLEKIKEPDKLDPQLYGFYFFLKGAGYYYLSEYEEALECAENGFKYGGTKDERVKYRLCNLMGAINAMFENLEEAKKFYDEAIEIAKRIITSKRGYVLLLTNIGSIYFREGKYSIAEKKYKEALQITTESDMKAYIFNWLAQLYFSRGEIEKAKNSLEEMFQEIKRSGADYYLNSYYQNFKNILLFEGKLEEAKGFNEKLRSLYKAYKDPEFELNVKFFDSLYELLKGNYDKALEIAMEMKIEREILKIDKYLLIAKIYTLKKENEKAEEYFKKAIELSPESSYRRKITYIPYFLFLYYNKREKEAIKVWEKIKEVPEIKAILFDIVYELKVFPLNIKPEEIFEFLKGKKLI